MRKILRRILYVLSLSWLGEAFDRFLNWADPPEFHEDNDPSKPIRFRYRKHNDED